MLFQKISIPLPWRAFWVSTPTPLETPVLFRTAKPVLSGHSAVPWGWPLTFVIQVWLYFLLIILAFEHPSPLEFPMTLLRVSMDIFWNCTIYRASFIESESILSLRWKNNPRNKDSYKTLNPVSVCKYGNDDQKINACEPWLQSVWWFHHIFIDIVDFLVL